MDKNKLTPELRLKAIRDILKYDNIDNVSGWNIQRILYLSYKDNSFILTNLISFPEVKKLLEEKTYD